VIPLKQECLLWNSTNISRTIQTALI